MASTTTATNNKLIAFIRNVFAREYIRENEFSPYMGNSPTAIFRFINELKKGGEQINIPMVKRLKQTAIGVGPLVGNEEAIDNSGTRMWIDWARNAVKINDAEMQKSSIDLWAEARPLLLDWGKELLRNEIVDALFAVPSQSAPVGLGSTDGQRVNGILFDSATSTQRNQWLTDNADRVLFGGLTGNLVSGNYASSCTNITSGMTLSAATVTKMKRIAKKADPHIRPFRPYQMYTGREYFVLFAGSNAFRDLSNDTTIVSANTNARAREGNGMDKNPLFQDGDLIYNGVIIREVPEIDQRLPTFYTTAGAGGTVQVSPVWMCGQSAVGICYGRLPTPTFLKEDDYQFFKGSGVKMAYGIGKIAALSQAGNFIDWGIVTGIVASASDV